MSERCSHNHDRWVEVTVIWCARCSCWLWRVEAVQPVLAWDGLLERLSLKSRLLPAEDTTPEDTQYLGQVVFALAQEVEAGDYLR